MGAKRRASIFRWAYLFMVFYEINVMGSRLGWRHVTALAHVARLFARFVWARWRTGSDSLAFDSISQPATWKGPIDEQR